MKKEKTNLTRRSFLSKSAAVAAGTSIIAIAATPQTAKGNVNSESAMLTNDPVFTDSPQTLTNKTINSFYNTLGSIDLNVREFAPNGQDITTALNNAISFLTNLGYGGTILIPASNQYNPWLTDGGHDLVSGIVIEGAGYKTNILSGSVIKLKEGASDFVFRVKAPWQNCSLRRLTINMEDNKNAVGLLLTDHVNGAIQGTNIYFTNVEEVNFSFGKCGIKVDSKETNGVSTNFECIMNRFERVVFYQCKTAFSCNSINGGYAFDNCYFNLPTPNGTAIDCKWVGNISLNHCLFVGNQTAVANVPPTDGSTILKTVGAYNNISFYDCQDENVQYYYQNSTNAWDVPIVFQNCIIQASFKYTANGTVIFDSCAINVTDIGSGHAKVTDTASAAARVYYRGLTKLMWHFYPPQNTRFDDFVNPYSQLIYESYDVGAPVVKSVSDAPPPGGYYIINATRGAVNVEAGSSYIQVYSNLITANSLVFAQMRSYDPGGARIREVQCAAGYFVIYLNQNVTNRVNIGFTIEG